MTVKIVTDSTADLPPELVKEFDITVVPLYTVFGHEVLRDGVDIGPDKFFERLLSGTVLPKTTQPSPADFEKVYRELGKNASGVVSIHISRKFSGTTDSAEEGARLAMAGCPVKVIDSKLLSMGQGLVVKAAAAAAKCGAGVETIAADVADMIPKIKLLGFFDTLKYVNLGGRLGQAKILLGSLLGVKPVLTVIDGEYQPSGRVRSRAKGIERLVEFVAAGKNIVDLSVIHSTTPEEARDLAGILASRLPGIKPIIARVGAVLGAHAGPGTLWVAYRES